MDAQALQRDLGRLEGTVGAQGERIDALDAKLDAHNRTTTEKLDRILAFQERQKGGAKILLTVSTAAAACFGGLASLVIDFVKRGN